MIINVPCIAGPMPPSAEPIAPGRAVRNSQLIAGYPFFITSNNILPRGIIAIKVQNPQKKINKLLISFLFAAFLWVNLSNSFCSVI